MRVLDTLGQFFWARMGGEKTGSVWWARFGVSHTGSVWWARFGVSHMVTVLRRVAGVGQSRQADRKRYLRTEQTSGHNAKLVGQSKQADRRRYLRDRANKRTETVFADRADKRTEGDIYGTEQTSGQKTEFAGQRYKWTD